MAITATKRCKRCDETKSTEEFARDRTRDDGLAFYCRACKSDYAKDAHRRLYDPERQRWVMMKYKYGLSREQYEEMYERQRGLCAICEGTEPRYGYLVVDHCHETGRIRGLLCNPCNQALGQFRDDAQVLWRAVIYLGGE